MLETLWTDLEKNQIVTDGKTISFAHGNDPTSIMGILIFVHLLAFPFLLSLFMWVTKKYELLPTNAQFMVPFLFTILVTISSFILTNKKISLQRVNVPIEQRENVISIDLVSKKVTVKEKNKITDTYTLSSNDYFWFAEQDANNRASWHTPIYYIAFVHNNIQTFIASSAINYDMNQLLERLEKLGFTTKKDN